MLPRFAAIADMLDKLFLITPDDNLRAAITEIIREYEILAAEAATVEVGDDAAFTPAWQQLRDLRDAINLAGLSVPIVLEHLRAGNIPAWRKP